MRRNQKEEKSKKYTFWLKSSLSVHMQSAVLIPLIILPWADPGFPVGAAGGRGYAEAPTYKFATFFQKLYEIKKILEGTPPPVSATGCIGALVKTC